MTARGYARLLAVLACATVIAAAAWAAIPPGGLTVAFTPSAGLAEGGMSWLHTDRQRIVDGQGRVVLLRGFNDDALLGYPWRRPPALEESDAALIRRAGFNLVRLPISWSRIEPQRGHFDGAYLDQIASAVAMLERHGLYTVLDMHFLPGWGLAFDAPSAPAWAQIPDLPNVNWLQVDPFGKDTNPAEMAAEVHFWSSPDWQSDFELAWRAVAGRLVHDPGLAGYDLYNEPHPFPIPPRLFEQWYMWPLYARTIRAIAGVDPSHLFFVESTLFGNTATAMIPLRAPDLVYSPHLYTGALVPGILSPGPNPVARSIHERVREAGMLPAALWFGELGIQHDGADGGKAAAWADDALNQLDAAGAGWAWWQWRQDGGWGIRSESGGSLDLAFLAHLARPFVAADPAGVAASSSAGRLRITVSAAHGAAPILIDWPGLTEPPPVESSNCGVVGAYVATASTLTVSVPPGVSCEVAVQPA